MGKAEKAWISKCLGHVSGRLLNQLSMQHKLANQSSLRKTEAILNDFVLSKGKGENRRPAPKNMFYIYKKRRGGGGGGNLAGCFLQSTRGRGRPLRNVTVRCTRSISGK